MENYQNKNAYQDPAATSSAHKDATAKNTKNAKDVHSKADEYPIYAQFAKGHKNAKDSTQNPENR